ncbi:MAG: glycosyltransferase [Planctomycetia bacterium]|nr:glycosyltransferase [Planctomycetia bacterium]
MASRPVCRGASGPGIYPRRRRTLPANPAGILDAVHTPMLRTPAHAAFTPPRIPPVAGSEARPLFSVMVPTCEPDEMLCRTLESVLRQAPARDVMQITIVDDASTPGLVTDLVRSVDCDRRITVIDHDRRLGLSGNWNRAISLARGELVHLLHQDDYVLPGFYARIARGFMRAPGVGMAFCRSRIVDAGGRHVKTNSRQQWLSGVLANWLPTIAERQRIQTPAAVVPRNTYEAVGGFRSDLCHALDWEMWVRIAARYRVWYEPRALAVYRRHVANETTRLFAMGAVWPDMARAIRINAAALPESIRDRSLAASVRWHAASALRTARRQLAAGANGAAAETLRAIPDLLDLIDGGLADRSAERRLAVLQMRLDDDQLAGRRAA